MGDDWTDYETTMQPTRPPGGQHVGADLGRITVTHIPTGTSATVTCRSQHRAKQLARMMVDFGLESGWV
jgi:protein subunit release factor B